MTPIYEVNFRAVNNNNLHTELLGFENIKTAGYFEPGWNMNLLFHDIFEHFFEDSKYFKTSQLSQAGECVALGIREYFVNNSSLVDRFAAFNKYRGNEWNTWNTILGQISDTLEGNTQYPNDFNYSHLDIWQKENNFEGVASYYNDLFKVPDHLLDEAETAFSYGYFLGEYLFSDMLYIINDFCENLNLFLDKLCFNNQEMYDLFEMDIDNELLNVKIYKNNIVANFGGIIISSKQDQRTVLKAIKQFENKFNYQYEY